MTVLVEMAGSRGSFRRVAFTRYLAAFAAMSLAWEFIQVPLYTIAVKTSKEDPFHVHGE
jgi:hypothetical protein